MRKTKFYMKNEAITSKIAKAGPHAEWAARCAMRGHAANDWAMPTRLTRRAFAHVAARGVRVRPGSHVQGRAHGAVGRCSCGRANWTTRNCTLLKDDSNDWSETVVEQSQRSHGCHHHVLETERMDKATSHNFRHSE